MEQPVLTAEERIVLWQEYGKDYSLDSRTDLALCANQYILSAHEIQKTLKTAELLRIQDGAFADTYGIEVRDFCIYEDEDEIPARYIVLLEAYPDRFSDSGISDAPEKAAAAMDVMLRRRHLDYDDCRNLGEIGMPVVYFLKQGASSRYQKYLQAQGMETGQYKPVRILDTEEKKEFFFREIVFAHTGVGVKSND